MREKITNTSKKLITLILLTVLFVPVLVVVNFLVYEREDRQSDSVREISEKWGGSQMIDGPYIIVPGRPYGQQYHYFAPKDLKISGTIETESKARGIYSVPVYTGDFTLTGSFGDLTKQTSSALFWDEAKIAVGISDMHGATEIATMKLNDTLLESNANDISSAFTSSIALDPEITGDRTFEINLKLKGSTDFYIKPIGSTTSLHLDSNWSSPSFDGNFLPDSHSITEDGFVADWQVLSINTGQKSYFTNSNLKLNSYLYDGFGVEFFVESDIYTKTKRAIKYGIVMVALVFISFFMIEMTSGRRVHPFQYLLIGFALIVFYTLLLSLAEYISFNLAYLVATAAIIGLIGTFSKNILKSKKLALVNSGILFVLYSFIFLLLGSKDFTLLIGSIGIFIILGLVMHFSQNIDWYPEAEASKSE
jgi:inner membrane protein